MVNIHIGLWRSLGYDIIKKLLSLPKCSITNCIFNIFIMDPKQVICLISDVHCWLKCFPVLIQYIATCLTLMPDICSGMATFCPCTLKNMWKCNISMRSVSTALISLSYLEIILCQPADSWQMFSVCSFKSNHRQKIRQHSRMQFMNVLCRWPPQQLFLTFW